MILDRRATAGIARRSVRRSLDIVSANLAIGVASAFVLAVSALSFAADRENAGRGTAGGDWSLRGALSTADQPITAGRYALHSS